MCLRLEQIISVDMKTFRRLYDAIDIIRHASENFPLCLLLDLLDGRFIVQTLFIELQIVAVFTILNQLKDLCRLSLFRFLISIEMSVLAQLID